MSFEFPTPASSQESITPSVEAQVQEPQVDTSRRQHAGTNSSAGQYLLAFYKERQRTAPPMKGDGARRADELMRAEVERVLKDAEPAESEPLN